jgi:hypothetical protein
MHLCAYVEALYMRICMFVCDFVCMCMCMYVFACLCACACVCKYAPVVHNCVREYAHHTHTNTYTHTHTGGQVPRQPQYPEPLGATGLLPALENIARHRDMVDQVSACLEECIMGQVTSKNLCAVMHRCRSEQVRVLSAFACLWACFFGVVCACFCMSVLCV